VPRRRGRAGLAARRRAARGVRIALTLALAWTIPLVAAPPGRAEPVQPPAGAEPADAVVAGSVRVLTRGLFGGLREAEDRSGVLVYLTGFRTPPPDRVAYLRQRGESFEPRLLPVVAGQTVSFPNEDPIYHNVFSVSPVQRFDLGQYRAGEPPRSQVFASPGLVPVYCNIHPKMISYVAVLENGAFATTDAAGGFEIRAPAGPVTLHAWMPGAERVTRELELSPGERVALALEVRQVERIGKHKRKDGSNYPEKRRRY
jgi:hypothetical protein